MDTKFFTNPFAIKWKKKLAAKKEPAVCEHCNGDGFITKTEWTGTDDSHDVEVRCVCQED